MQDGGLVEIRQPCFLNVFIHFQLKTIFFLEDKVCVESKLGSKSISTEEVISVKRIFFSWFSIKMNGQKGLKRSIVRIVNLQSLSLFKEKCPNLL